MGSCFHLRVNYIRVDLCVPFVFLGVDFKMRTLEIDGVKVRVQIW